MTSPTTTPSDFGSFITKLTLLPPTTPQQKLPLGGLTFAVKDIFDVEGYITGFGNPDWAKTHAPAVSTAPVVMTLLEDGATCIGKTVMDEMAYSINGENVHYGTPVNPCAHDRVPGGSSSGSAVAVAAGLVDFALGTDTGGSIRVPASYCGIFGFRPSHSVVPTTGVIPMAQSFDTVGWFARDPLILNQVGRSLLKLGCEDLARPNQIIIPEDCFQLLNIPCERVIQVLTKSMEKLFGSQVMKHLDIGDYITRVVPSLKKFTDDNDKHREFIPSLMALSNAMRSYQRYEFKTNHGEWVNVVKPDLGPGISERVWEAITASDESIENFGAVKIELQTALTALLEGSSILVIPTVPGPPPKLQTQGSSLETFRIRAFSLLSIVGVSGFCQVSIPLGKYENLPVSISLVAKHGADRFLLNVVEMIYSTIQEEIQAAEKASY